MTELQPEGDTNHFDPFQLPRHGERRRVLGGTRIQQHFQRARVIVWDPLDQNDKLCFRSTLNGLKLKVTQVIKLQVGKVGH